MEQHRAAMINVSNIQKASEKKEWATAMQTCDQLLQWKSKAKHRSGNDKKITAVR